MPSGFPNEMDQSDIKRVINDFGSADKICKDGRLDGIEVMASVHLLDQFLSPILYLITVQMNIADHYKI